MEKVFGYKMTVLIVLLSSLVTAKNADISYWTKNVSEMTADETTGLHDFNAEVAISGQTVHLLWMVDSAMVRHSIYYRRSLDGGQTWENRIRLYSADYHDIINSSDQERLAVSGNSVHVVFNGYARGATGWAGKLIYLRSVDNGATFEPPRVLFLAASAHHVLNTRVRAEGKRLLIPFQVQTNWLVNNSGRLLISEDAGLNFQESQIYYSDTGSGWKLADLCHQGDNIHALFMDSQYYYGIQYGDLYLASSRDAGKTFKSQLVSVPSANGNHKTFPLFDANYTPKLAIDGDNVWVVWAGQDLDDLLSVFVRHSRDNGQTFDPAVNVSRDELPDGMIIQAGQETIAARKNFVYVVFNSAKGKLFFRRSLNSGTSFDRAQPLCKDDGTTYLDTGIQPLVRIDPNDASGKTVHLVWSWFTHDYSIDGGKSFRGPLLLSPHFSWGGLGPRLPRMAIDHLSRLHVVQEGGWSYYSASGYGDQDIFYRCYDVQIPPAKQENQALKLDFFMPSGETGESRADNMHIPPHKDLAFTTAMTAEFWFKLDGGASLAPMRLLVKENTPSAFSMPKGYQIGLYVAGDHWCPCGGIKTKSGEYMAWSEHIMQPERWTHFALTYDSSAAPNNLRLYIDGQLSASATADGGIIAEDGFLFLGAVSKTDGSQGAIDDVRLWSRALAAAEIGANMAFPLTGSETGLVAYYPLNGTTSDVTGHGHDGLLMYKETFIASSIFTRIAAEIFAAVPVTTTLLPNFPNPFNPETRINFALAVDSQVEITIYNIHGQVVEILLDKEMPAGDHSLPWNHRDLSSGVYICRMKAGDFLQSRRMVLVR